MRFLNKEVYKIFGALVLVSMAGVVFATPVLSNYLAAEAYIKYKEYNENEGHSSNIVNVAVSTADLMITVGDCAVACTLIYAGVCAGPAGVIPIACGVAI